MFQFKQFFVQDNNATMKVGTDSVLLGCLANYATPQHILDIGTGCGVIALIMAQRFPYATIDAIDIDEGSIADATENFGTCPWSDHLTPHLSALQQWDKDAHYDLIVSNPPYFVNSLKCPSEKRNKARHNDTLPFDVLLFHASRLLTAEGDYWCILPPTEAEEVTRLAKLNGLYCSERYHIHNKPESTIRRTVLHFTKAAVSFCQEHQCNIRTNDNNFSDWYYQTTKDFYLWEEQKSILSPPYTF